MTTRFRPIAGAFQPLLVQANRFGGPLLLFALMVLAYWRILLTDQYSWLNGQDLSSQVLPWLQFQAGELHAGRFPLWSPYEWGGQNLIGQGQPGVVNPLNWLLFAMPLRRGWLREGALNWWFFFIHYVAALNLYALARSLGTSRLPAIFGGLAFGLLGFLGSNDWPQMICGLVWAPLVFRFLLQANYAWAGFFLGLCWLSGHHQLPIFVSLAVAATAIAFRLYPAILTFIVAGLLAAPQLLPGLAYGRTARRWVGMDMPVGWQDKVAYFVHEQYANGPSALFSILLPGAELHTSLFLGCTALVLAIWAIRTNWIRREVKLFTGLGIGALLYGLGRFGGLEPLLYSLLPMIEKARSPSMAGAIFTMSFAVLAALGMELHRSKPAHPISWRIHWGFGALVILLFSFAKLLPANQTRLEERWFAVAFVSLLVGLAYYAVAKGQMSQRTLYPLLLCAILIESANMNYFNMGNRHDKYVTSLLTPMSRHMDIREFLLTLPQPLRVTIDEKAIPYNFGDWQGVDVMGGYLASLDSAHVDLNWSNPRAAQLIGVGYHIGPTPRTEGSQLLFQGEHGINLWQNPLPPFPRAWLSSSTISYRNRDEADAYIDNQSIDLRQVTLTHNPVAGLESCPPGDTAVLLHNPGRVLIRTHANCNNLLVISDSDDAGWSVTVDGKPAQRINAFHALRAVQVPKGSHTVEWRYSAPGFRPGLALAAAGLLIPLWSSYRRKKQNTKGGIG
ncbi:YfhO family protein [Bryobacter aggregatus]|uniref:YfhO family protein n=1 Tax=Bryobacter aggregatus TaxID=360054 RepID=UPI0004E1D1F0|nr:YfhO family protein [Bryobacter aggregatus]